MEFVQLNPEQRQLLLQALGFDTKNLKCQFCGETVPYERCSIMPAVKTKLNATILCESILCLSEYFTALDIDSDKS
jgi:hypothetical protein